MKCPSELEKPLALTATAGQALAAVRQRLASDEVGPLRYCSGRLAGSKRARTDLGVTMSDTIHYFDLLAYLLGQAPTAVTATLRDYLGRGLDDSSFSTVEYGHVPVFIEAGTSRRAPIVIVSSSGSG